MKHTEKGNVVYMTEPTNVSKKPEPFYKSELVLVQEGKYTNYLVFELAGRNKAAIDAVKDFCNPGREVEVDFVLNAREYNGKYYQSAKAIDARAADTQVNSSPASSPSPAQQPKQADMFADDGDGLPF